MATPFTLVSTFKVKEGSLENLRDFSRRVTELMQAKEPRIIAFHCFLSEDGTEMSTIHLHSRRGLHGIPHAGPAGQLGGDLQPVRHDARGCPRRLLRREATPDGALETFRRAGNEIRIKPTHLAGFTRA